MYLDYAENQAERQIPMKMTVWLKKLYGFLKFNENEILNDAGKIIREATKQLVEEGFEKFRIVQDRNYESDFDIEVKKLKK